MCSDVYIHSSRVAAKSSPLGVSVKRSKQSIMHLNLGYSFLKQDGRVFLTCCQLGHTIKTDVSSFDISLIQVIKILLTVVADTWNLKEQNLRAFVLRPMYLHVQK